MDARRILEQFTGHRGFPGGRGGVEDLLGGLLGGRGTAPQGTGMGSPMGGAPGGGLGGMLDAFGGRGPSGAGGLGGLADSLGGMLNKPPMGGGIGAAAAGGLLGSILGGGGRRGGGGSGLIRMGGLAILGALAHRAYKDWQAKQGVPGSAPVPTPAAPEAPAADSQPLGLALIRAMIAAAKADGVLDGEERERIFAEVERLDLADDEKGFVFAAMREEADPRSIAALARDEGQKAQIYLASRLVAAPDSAAERAWLEALAHELKLPAGLKQVLDQQAKDAAAAAEAVG
ncbi:tellurite resistance TerB family protein [Roseococcus sp. DSY-14]|uniref:tellurite resistance TerB family protein n=1 Tax=Roseococcus sp. DSY-14 TaxID=3369650 RepID=UPI00387B4A28